MLLAAAFVCFEEQSDRLLLMTVILHCDLYMSTVGIHTMTHLGLVVETLMLQQPDSTKARENILQCVVHGLLDLEVRSYHWPLREAQISFIHTQDDSHECPHGLICSIAGGYLLKKRGRL